jgi:cytochrome c oxidase accessory protein FixG
MNQVVIPIVSDNGAAPFESLYVSEAKIQPRSVSGWFATWRWLLVWFTQLLFYGLPWLSWNGRQAVLLDLAARRFYIFGMVLHPQDVIYLAGLLILSAFALFLFTTVAGRVWCGYACPQTVYTEIFMWVERRFEGDRQARIKLDAAPWSPRKLARRGGKQVVWLALGVWTGFTFVAYFTPARSLAAEVASLSLGPWESFWILFYGFATYGNAGYMREQVCKYMCPYARFQSVMFDRDTLVISYDVARGEPRGSRRRGVDAASVGKGDCIDCTLCVQVCPTGIDIRKGLQYECIGCAACIDACDSVMDKMQSPRGLIRYATQNGIEGGWSRRQMWMRALRPRLQPRPRRDRGGVRDQPGAAHTVQGRHRSRSRRPRPHRRGRPDRECLPGPADERDRAHAALPCRRRGARRGHGRAVGRRRARADRGALGAAGGADAAAGRGRARPGRASDAPAHHAAGRRWFACRRRRQRPGRAQREVDLRHSTLRGIA